jgi:hypothetical protein
MPQDSGTNASLAYSISTSTRPGTSAEHSAEPDSAPRGVIQARLVLKPLAQFPSRPPQPPLMDVDEKTCRVCGVVKGSEEFARDSRRSGGVASICRECDRERCRRYDAEHRDERRAAYRVRNPAPQSWAERMARIERRAWKATGRRER